jgi:hypothetical protein
MLYVGTKLVSQRSSSVPHVFCALRAQRCERAGAYPLVFPIIEDAAQGTVLIQLGPTPLQPRQSSSSP